MAPKAIGTPLVTLVALIVVVTVTSASQLAPSSTDGCNVERLSPCVPAILGGSASMEECCSNLRAQKGCLCQYMSDPELSVYMNSPNAHQVLAICGISTPSC